ncbi:MAG: M56 family metallopeptidase [Lachnospiraceae bacterium]|nr:M56 family metallopeptidase [Lachnospiraceae bacterium]
MYLQITITSVASTIFFSLCFAILLELALRNEQLLSKIRYELLLICMVIPVIKVIVPVEILPWSRNIAVSRVLPEVVQFVNKELGALAEITLWELVMIVLLIGSLIKACAVMYMYIRFRRFVNMLPQAECKEAQSIITRILEEKGKRVAVELKWKAAGESPEITGFLQPTILLPKSEYSKTELECILRHEMAHWLHGDMIIRFVWIIIKILCWWNPIIYMFDRQFETLLELCADSNAVKNAEEDAACDYMEMLVRVAKEANHDSESVFCSYLLKEKGMSPQQRVRLILAREQTRISSVWVCNLIAATCMITLTIAMNVFVFEPKGEVPEVENYEGTKTVTSSECFLVKNASGSYDMYMNGVFCAVLEDSFGSGLPIYDTLEEALEHEEN